MPVDPWKADDDFKKRIAFCELKFNEYRDSLEKIILFTGHGTERHPFSGRLILCIAGN
jgi:hypothetical protein